MGGLPLSPAPLTEDLLKNLIVHLIAHFPRQPITLCLLHYGDEFQENRSGLNGFGNDVLLVARLLSGDRQRMTCRFWNGDRDG